MKVPCANRVAYPAPRTDVIPCSGGTDGVAGMRIVDIRERTFPISSPIRNAVIDFSRMTLSVVAVVTDVVREGRPVVGYGFHSNGRYGQGAMLRGRFIPRVLESDRSRCWMRTATSTPRGSGPPRCVTRSPVGTGSGRSR